MARQKRKWYEGAVYHVMGRGNRRTVIYKEKEDYYVFLQILANVRKKRLFTLHAYCLCILRNLTAGSAESNGR